MANGLHGKNLAQSETLCTWRSSLRGTWEVSSMPGLVCRAGSGRPTSRTPSMHVDEKSDEAIVLAKQLNKGASPGGSRGGWASPKGSSR